MINLRVALASTLTFAVLLLLWIQLTQKGYENAAVLMQEKNRKAAEFQEKLDSLAKEDMADLGARAMENAADIVPDELADPGMRARQRRPLGTWMGYREDNDKKAAYMKFDKENYWILVDNPGGADIREHGKYEYDFNAINFTPEGEEPYRLNYFMVSREAIQLVGFDFHYNLKSAENEIIEF